MCNLVYGILTISICTIGFYFAWKLRNRNHVIMSLLLLMVCGFLLRLYTSTDFYLHDWDERYHALVAKNLIQHPLIPTLYDDPILPYDYQNWTGNHIWLHKQPLPLWCMAGSMWLFGINEIALRLPSIILTTLGIWLTFFIGTYLFNRNTGFLAAFFYSINGLILEMTGGRIATDHIDVFFLFFVELAVFFSIMFARKKQPLFNILAGISIGAAILSKWLPALIVLPVWILVMMDSGRFRPRSIALHFMILVMTAVAVFLPWQLYIYHSFPLEARWEAGSNFRHLTRVLEQQGGPIYYFLDKIRINYGELIYLPLLWFLWKTLKNLKNFKWVAVSIWFVIPFLFFSFAKTKMQGYLLFTSPALFLMTAEFWSMLKDYRKEKRLKWISVLLMFLLIALPARYAVERMKPFEKRERHPQWVTELKKLNEKDIKHGVLFNYDRPVEAMFYTGLTAYSGIPDTTVISSLLDKGYSVLVYESENTPVELRGIQGVIFIKE